MAPSGKWIDGIGQQTPVEEAARRSLEPRLATVAQCLPLAAHFAEHDIEHVHRLRVATRRAAAARKLYRDWLPQKTARWVKKRLRKIRRAAGEARDLDVLIDRLQSELGERGEPVVRFLAEKRAGVQPDIIAIAENLRREDRFVRKAARLVSKIRPPDSESEPAAAKLFGEWATQLLATIGAEFLASLPNEAANIEALHQFRIRAKDLRYAIELLAPAFGPSLRQELYPVVEELQERLGAITDHTAAMKLLAEWQSREADHASSADSNALLAMEKQKQIEDLHNFQQWWTPDRVEWLKHALAEQSNTSRV